MSEYRGEQAEMNIQRLNVRIDQVAIVTIAAIVNFSLWASCHFHSCEFLLGLKIWFMFCCFDFKNFHRYHQQCFFLSNMDLGPLVAPGGVRLESGKLPEKKFPSNLFLEEGGE